MILNQLMPAAVWRAFEEISRLPRGSGSKEGMAEYLYSEAMSHGMMCYLDESHNLFVRIPATDGRDDEKPIVIKAHLDKICVKADESEHEFEEDGIELMTEGDRVWANGATLGADDGIGVAMMLAILRDRDLNHPELELIFTTDALKLDEDVAFNRDLPDDRWHINLDYDEDGMILNGTAGVMISEMTLPIRRDGIVKCEALHLVVQWRPEESGMSGSPWGCSAVQILGRLLAEVKEDTVLVDIHSDHHYSERPFFAAATIVSEVTATTIMKLRHQFELIKTENILPQDAKLSIGSKWTEDTSISMDSYDHILACIALTPSMVLEGNSSEGIHDYANNMYSLITEEERIIMGNMTRYAHQSQGKDFSDRMYFLADLIGADISVLSNVPVWEPENDSKLMEIRKKAYHMPRGMNLQATFSHRSTETAVIAGNIDSPDTITLGPDIRDAHTVNETLSVSSVQRTYNLLRSILASHDSHK